MTGFITIIIYITIIIDIVRTTFSRTFNLPAVTYMHVHLHSLCDCIIFSNGNFAW